MNGSESNTPVLSVRVSLQARSIGIDEACPPSFASLFGKFLRHIFAFFMKF